MRRDRVLDGIRGLIISFMIVRGLVCVNLALFNGSRAVMLLNTKLKRLKQVVPV